ncbi:SNF1-related protein kinase regulatory subunit gamma-1 [Jatropha curcas]|uniref:SNF1-related protein kinase regulatory subunit gamma-1 n=1 Tax=Jatropha curcas TaxID=180498 RepID=UPI0018956983|nr:SNF1-related protein kinase regulatory subunit gamma-1 [Jatropha curcas]
MQELKEMNVWQVEDGKGVIENIKNDQKQEIDPCTALQIFLDRIPISSIPGIQNSPVVNLKAGDSIKDSIQLLHEKNVSGAPITDVGRFSNQYVGFIDFVSLVLWSLEQCEKAHIQAKHNSGGDDGTGKSSFFALLEQNPEIGETKVAELAKSFLWDPFFPVNLDDTLFHVLMLLSKHRRLQVVPVIEQLGFQVIGFVTQNAVIQLLLQSSGLEWFDGIADKALFEFRFPSEEQVILTYGDQSIAEALHILWESRIVAIAVINRETEKIIGCFSNSDVYLLLENDELLDNRKKITVAEFIHMETGNADADPAIEQDLGALFSAGALCLKSRFLPRMHCPVTAKRSDTLKQTMKKVAETKGNFCFLVDDSQKPIGMFTLRDIIIQFAPPCIDSGVHGGGFFESALEQTGCQVKNGTIVCDH